MTSISPEAATMILDYTIVIPGRLGVERIPVRGRFMDWDQFARRRRFEEMRGYKVESVREVPQ